MDEIYTRAYVQTSPRKLVSGKGPTGDTLSHTKLLNEFRNQAQKWNPEPTALVSASNRIVDTVKRGFEMHYEEHKHLADIWIAFIKVPAATDEILTHRARDLAEECGLPNPNRFQHEIVFEWAIPEECVLHKVSLQTLVDRGLDWRDYLTSNDPNRLLASTAELRAKIAVDLQPNYYGAYEIGLHLGFFAKKFGARAPLNWIAHQLFYDCVQTKIVDGDVIWLNYADGHSMTVDSNFMSELDQGIETALCDWWLADPGFLLDYNEFEEWRDAMEDCMVWDLIDFWETWGDNCDTGLEKSLCEQAWDKLSAKHESTRAKIDTRAVMIGL